MSDILIRLLREEDWEEVVTLEERAYAASGLSEGEAALRSRHGASPSTCFVLEHAGGFGGYLLALPYPPLRCPDLGLAEEGAGEGSNLHLHDLVIAEQTRGQGLGRRMQQRLEETGRAARYETLSLVSVQGSRELWSRLGYRGRPDVGLPASYGADALYMAKPLGSAGASAGASAGTPAGAFAGTPARTSAGTTRS
ncbi:GNAT family N-acetyltransferase [Streptomyces abyssomicinicus]|uniref:GNAT family N-acetyltransferase n=1 Tax=Streptomyces abyssomicinicus TaxID=574929 RepID=UPI001250149B|nr:GNAT family N-acetyltransferase [Streptomyces abyssomicinicus]